MQRDTDMRMSAREYTANAVRKMLSHDAPQECTAYSTMEKEKIQRHRWDFTPCPLGVNMVWSLNIALFYYIYNSDEGDMAPAYQRYVLAVGRIATVCTAFRTERVYTENGNSQNFGNEKEENHRGVSKPHPLLCRSVHHCIGIGFILNELCCHRTSSL